MHAVLEAIRTALKSSPTALAPLVAAYGLRLRPYGCSLRLDRATGTLLLRKSGRVISLHVSDNALIEQAAEQFDDLFQIGRPTVGTAFEQSDFSEDPWRLALQAAISGHALEFARRAGCGIHVVPGRWFTVTKGSKELRVALSQAFYLADACQMFDHYMAAIEPERIGDKLVADFSTERSHRVPGVPTPFVFSSFPELSETAEAYVAAFGLRQADIVIDAGAYCGLTACVMAAAIGERGRVIAIEADPLNYAALLQNLAEAKLPQVTPLHAAVWIENGQLDFASEGNMGSALSAVHPTRTNKVKVRSMTLDQVAREFALGRVDHVKIDIEGAERAVLLRSGEFVRRYRPQFLVEMHPAESGTLPTTEICKFFSDLDYKHDSIAQAGDETYPLIRFKPRST